MGAAEWGVIVAGGGLLLTLILWSLKTAIAATGAITVAKNTADSAVLAGARAEAEAEHVGRNLKQLDQAFANYRERMAGENVNKEGLREVETRVMGAVEKIGAASTTGIEGIHKRLDSVLTSLGALRGGA